MLGYVIVFIIAETAYAIGTALSAREVYRNRKTLQNYSLSGACLALIGSLGCKIGYFMTDQVASAMLGFPSVAYWAVIVLYKLRHKEEWGYSR